MNEEQIREMVVRILGRIAPEADLGNLESDRGFRDQFDFDSVDFLHFALALQDEAQVSIPEEDFPSLATLNGCIGYLLATSAHPA